jgi:hypothetical protein
MSNFRREDRYIVIKCSDMDKAPSDLRRSFLGQCRKLHDAMLTNGAPARSFLVIEKDWPEYEAAWQMIERRMTGAAPVVERQPTGQWRIPVNGDWFYGSHAQCVRERAEYESTFTDLDREEAGAVVPEQIHSGTPPELAELQATIARLTAENERLASRVVVVEKYEDECLRLLREAEAERDHLKAEIERLKGGQGEPVEAILLSDCVELNHKAYGAGYFSTEVVKLYTSHPALVSAALPERLEQPPEYCSNRRIDAYTEGWNACLDKVKELSQ